MADLPAEPDLSTLFPAAHPRTAGKAGSSSSTGRITEKRPGYSFPPAQDPTLSARKDRRAKTVKTDHNSPDAAGNTFYIAPGAILYPLIVEFQFYCFLIFL